MNNTKKSFPFLSNKFYSFIIDPFLLVAVGLLVVFLSVKFLNKRFPKFKKYIAWSLFILAIFIFWAIAGALYLDFLNVSALGAYGSGNNFMWNSGVEVFGLEPFFKFTTPTYMNVRDPMNILAFAIFLTYPLFLYLGVRIGRILFKKARSRWQIMKEIVTKKIKKIRFR